ncbi:hypothetical protein [Candidatus Uabimicrobium sp. HlEnr_7]|uniref:hypothetical protein n=1 Tax=Candidatus Uabimicrobium helgolandensis TaxID=3095367 RepID=UPI0035582A61
MEKPYLPIQYGDVDNLRGRVIIAIEVSHNPQKFAHSIIDINGTTLKEDLTDAIVYGRLIVPDVFIPSYVKTKTLNRDMSIQQLREFAQKEFRDLVVVDFDEISNGEVVNEQMSTRYLMSYYEGIYLRILESMSNEIFHNYRRYTYSGYYIAMFKIAQLICLLARSIKEQNGSQEYYKHEILKYQDRITILDLNKLTNVLTGNNGLEAQKAMEGLDSLFLSLKKDYSCCYSGDVFFSLDKGAQEWLSQGLPQLYYRFFHSLFLEDYEQASILHQEIDNFENTSSIKEFH